MSLSIIVNLSSLGDFKIPAVLALYKKRSLTTFYESTAPNIKNLEDWEGVINDNSPLFFHYI